jgi:hypothetical protein
MNAMIIKLWNNLRKGISPMEEKAIPGDSEACIVVINNVDKLCESDVYRRIIVHHDYGKLLDSEWEELRQAIDTAFPDFTIKLHRKHSSLSQREYRVCLLLKIGVRPSRIAKMLCCERKTISSIRRRLSEKMFGIPDPKMLDDFIRNI